jgi:hypothetical protein
LYQTPNSSTHETAKEREMKQNKPSQNKRKQQKQKKTQKAWYLDALIVGEALPGP